MVCLSDYICNGGAEAAVNCLKWSVWSLWLDTVRYVESSVFSWRDLGVDSLHQILFFFGHKILLIDYLVLNGSWPLAYPMQSKNCCKFSEETDGVRSWWQCPRYKSMHNVKQEYAYWYLFFHACIKFLSLKTTPRIKNTVQYQRWFFFFERESILLRILLIKPSN